MADSQLPTSRAVETLRRVTGALAGGEQRPGQEQMAAAVEQALRGRRHLVVQAGTGTGKSLGYLVPAVLSGRRVVVATATLALQDQLIGKDLPFLAANLGRPVDVALLKGRSNYACRQRLNEVEVALTSPQQLGMLATDAASQRRDGGKRRDPDPE